jgi:hypothetical protein
MILRSIDDGGDCRHTPQYRWSLPYNESHEFNIKSLIKDEKIIRIGVDLATCLEHKAEHNNCRMKGTEPNLQCSTTTVSA